jgi:hypothetical protein
MVMLADSGAAALVSTSVLADGLTGVLAQTPVQHVISVDTLDELPASPFGSMSYPDDLETDFPAGPRGRFFRIPVAPRSCRRLRNNHRNNPHSRLCRWSAYFLRGYIPLDSQTRIASGPSGWNKCPEAISRPRPSIPERAGPRATSAGRRAGFPATSGHG